MSPEDYFWIEFVQALTPALIAAVLGHTVLSILRMCREYLDRE